MSNRSRGQKHSPDPSQEPLRALVRRVETSYVVAYSVQDCGDLTTRDSITFSLSDWQGKDEPQGGQVVELIDTALYARGWRAMSARPVIPTHRAHKEASR